MHSSYYLYVVTIESPNVKWDQVNLIDFLLSYVRGSNPDRILSLIGKAYV